MPRCNIVETIHNNRLQQSGNKVIYLYETLMGDLIHTFTHIENCKLWLTCGSIGKDLDFVSLRLKVVPKCRGAKLLANAMKSSNTWATCWRIEESLNSTNHGVAHTSSSV